MLQNIETIRIVPHPDNPRKDLGDLSELADSIKANGILQNLTVVPQQAGYCPSCRLYNGVLGKCENGHDDGTETPPCSKWESKGNYTVIIGHRRLAAAKMAGLDELPCVVADMDKKTQLATMLLENIQRSDLTVFEQAQGFQMMLDLGESVDSISKQTGFSATTVRRRVKMAELDRDKLKEVSSRNISLADFAELEKIKDINLRNEVLDSIGTINFNWKVQQAIDKEKSAENKAIILAKLPEFAVHTESTSGLQWVKNVYTNNAGELEKPEDAGEVKYYYTTPQYGPIALYREPNEETEEDKTEEKREWELREQERKERTSKLDEAAERAYELRRKFVKDFADFKNHTKDIMVFAVESILDGGYFGEEEEVLKMLGISEVETEEQDEVIISTAQRHPERVLLITTYCAANDSARNNYRNWEGKHSKNGSSDWIYDFLIKLGYEMSDEERALRDGTHELFGGEGE